MSAYNQVNMLRRRDAGVGRIRFVDIADPSYVPEENAGISYEQVRRVCIAQNRQLFCAQCRNFLRWPNSAAQAFVAAGIIKQQVSEHHLLTVSRLGAGNGQHSWHPA